MGSSNGGVPPGFRFHPTDEELLHYYLRKKVRLDKFDMEVIREVDLNKMEPWDLQERCKIGSTPQNDWYFFSHKDRKYPTGSKTNRATNAGFWKATGRDKCIRNSYNKIGMRKTLVFYRGRAPHGQKTDWIMHEYRLEDGDDPHPNNTEDGWVVCRVFKKKNLFKLGGIDGGISPESYRPPVNSNTNHFNRTMGLHGESHQYLLRPLHNLNHDAADQTPFGLNYPLVAAPPHVLFHPQTLAPNALKPHDGYHYTSPIMFKQLTMNSRDESGEGLELEICEPGGDAQPMMGGRDESLLLNEWSMLDRIMTSHLGDEDGSSKDVRFEDGNGSSDQPSLRGEMDFWGYDK